MISAHELRNGFSRWGQQGRTLEELTAGLPAAETARLLAGWELHGRTDQVPPEGDWTVWLLLGGRGAGKTRAGAEWVRGVALGLHPYAETPAGRIALVGETFADAREVMIEGISGLLSLPGDHERPVWLPARRMLTWSNGSRAQVFSAEDPESLRGPQFSAAWSDGSSRPYSSRKAASGSAALSPVDGDADCCSTGYSGDVQVGRPTEGRL